MVLGDGVFGNCLGHEGEALMNGISVLMKDPLPLPPWEDTGRSTISELEGGLSPDVASAGTVTLDSQPPEL